MPYLEPVVQHLALALAKYKHKNLLMLYNAIGTLADAVGVELRKSDYAESLMPLLLDHWSIHDDEPKILVSLLEVLRSWCIKSTR